MLKRLSSLILALLLGGTTLAGTATRHGEHLCEMAGTGMDPGVETTPCCTKHETGLVLSESRSSECCFTNTPENGVRETAFNVNARHFSIAVSHPETEHSSTTLVRPFRSSYEQVLPDLQHSYLRNLSFLI
jgi:hypothetical protein